MHYLSILSTIVTAIFAAAVLGRYFKRGGMHLLFWGIGLVFYGLGTLSEALMIFTYHPLILKLWYLTGAMLTAAWLGQGTVFLLVRKRGVAAALAVLLGVVSLICIALISGAPLTNVAYQNHTPASSQYEDILVRIGPVILLTILLNIYGTLTMVGGALYSAWLFWRKKVLVNRLVGNILIAAGAMLPAMGGSFIRAGLPDWLYLSEFLGAVVMYLGFIQATYPQPAPDAQAQRAHGV
jgi:hypothetical protein